MSDPFDDLCKHGWLWDGPCVWCENERLRAEVAEAKEQVGDLIDDAAAGDPKDRVWVLVPLAEVADANNHHVEMQRHRDAWRKYAYGRGERPQDFLDGNMVPSDRGPTRIEELERIMKDVSFVPIQKKQIDEMWEYLSEIGSRGVAEGYEQALFDLGFSRCEECGGSGKKESRSSSMREEPMLWTCPFCAKYTGHGWVIENTKGVRDD